MSQLFQLQKRLPKWRLLFVKNGYKKTCFLSKSSIFLWFEQYDFVQISLAYGTNISKGMYEETLDFQGQH